VKVLLQGCLHAARAGRTCNGISVVTPALSSELAVDCRFTCQGWAHVEIPFQETACFSVIQTTLQLDVPGTACLSTAAFCGVVLLCTIVTCMHGPLCIMLCMITACRMASRSPLPILLLLSCLRTSWTATVQPFLKLAKGNKIGCGVLECCATHSSYARLAAHSH
jgi:hypothetical protein